MLISEIQVRACFISLSCASVLKWSRPSELGKNAEIAKLVSKKEKLERMFGAYRRLKYGIVLLRIPKYYEASIKQTRGGK